VSCCVLLSCSLADSGKTVHASTIEISIFFITFKYNKNYTFVGIIIVPVL
jgi:hypothetical protein